MSQAENGNLVSVEYTGRLLDGTVFDSNVGEDALQFTLGQGQVIAGFDNAVRGLQVGESVETSIPPESAYGDHQDDLILEFERSQFPADADPEIGMEVMLSNGTQQFPAIVAAVDEDTVTLDANHRLAGETLVFTIKLLAID